MNISQVSKKYGLPSDTLRFYEKVGLIPAVRRNANGLRDYSPADCNWIEFIKSMSGAGLCVERLAEYVKLANQGDQTLAKRKQILLRERDELQQRIRIHQKVLTKLNHRIEKYNKLLAGGKINV